MNLEKLFKAQKELDDRIVEGKGLQGKDLLDKKILALQVELGELANNWRGFKFWSEHQKPITEVPCFECDGRGGYMGYVNNPMPEHTLVKCGDCDGTGKGGNPLLEEYVDCLHFILSIGLEIGIRPDELKDLHIWNADGVSQFNSLFAYSSELYVFYWSVEYTKKEMKAKYINLLEGLLGLGIYGLGFTWKEIEQAYYEKNKINHERQTDGY